jgi:hypothetical protein
MAEEKTLDIPAVSIEVTPGGILVRCDPMPAEAAVLAACLSHAAAQLQLLSSVAVAQHGADAVVGSARR